MPLLLHEDFEEAMGRESLNDRLIITPMLDKDAQIGASTIDLRLGTEFIETSRRFGAFDPIGPSDASLGHQTQSRSTTPLGGSIVLHPAQMLLGCTLEFVRLPADIAGMVLSRSSWGRIGLTVATAAAVQPGWTGMITLQLVNLGSVPITLYPGLRVAQLLLWRAARDTAHGYGRKNSKYFNPLGPEPSKLDRERDELSRIQWIGTRLGINLPSTKDESG